jgi:hypothetical protein
MASVVCTQCATMCCLWGITFRIFSLRVEIDEREKKNLFPLQYSNSTALLFLRQELRKTEHSTICNEWMWHLFQCLKPFTSDGQFSHPQELRFKQTFMNAGRVPVNKKETFYSCCFEQLLTLCYLITNCVLSSVERTQLKRQTVMEIA